MSVEDRNRQEEDQRVQLVIGKIEGQIRQLEDKIGTVKTDVLDIRKHFWDHVSVDFSSADDVVETLASMKQQAEVLTERERSYSHASALLGRFKRLIRTPYFGRIDFQEDGTPAPEKIYLGIASLLDDDGETFLIYDWRAPLSSLYYDYALGRASYETPMGEISGDISLKRQYMIRDGKLRLMFDTGITVGDEILQEALGSSSDTQMRSIVATIQKEQNRIIRNDKSRMLVVQGAAGSGKTSAALQRVAYLLYKYRETLSADQMVLFSPNPLFNSYVSTVLPELGEENMLQTTFQEYLEHRLGKNYEVENPFDQLEYVLSDESTPGYSARMEGIRYKSSERFLAVILAYKELLEKESMLFRSIRFRGRVLISSERIREKFYSYDPAFRLPNRLGLIREWMLEELKSFEQKERKAAWVEEAAELLDREDYLRAYQELRRRQKGKKEDSFDDFEQEKEIIATVVVREELKPLRRRIKQLRFVELKGLYRQLFENRELFERIAASGDLPQEWEAICSQTISSLETNVLLYEDATPFLFLRELVEGFQTNPTIRYVIVDEAQDYSPFQLEFLKRLFPRCRMTALGDLNQAIYAHAPALGDMDPITRLYGAENTERIQLTRSYRSTREIVEFTSGMIPGGDEIEPFNRKGKKPKVLVASDRESLHDSVAKDIEALQADGVGTIAIICKTADESAKVFETLSSRMPVNLITKTSPTFEKGVLVIPAYLAKGMEFDAVLLYDGSQERYGRESERKLFYTACTRAMHLLHIHVLGEPSPFITALNPETYQLSGTGTVRI